MKNPIDSKPIPWGGERANARRNGEAPAPAEAGTHGDGSRCIEVPAWDSRADLSDWREGAKLPRR